jgi:glycosyltransferase involved in cell wall biosynthesis
MTERTGAVILGRICPEKGTHFGIAAARKVGLSLRIAGQVFGYPEHVCYFEDQIRPALGEDVVYVGPVGSKEKVELLRSAKCLLVPSIAPETRSLAAMEALACGTPVIAMKSGALPEIVEHGRTGFLVTSVDAMSDAISRVDALDPMTCRRVAEERFSSERMAREYIDLYKRLIELKNTRMIPSRGSLADSLDRRAA